MALLYVYASIFITIPLIFSVGSSELFEFPKTLLVYAYAAFFFPYVVYCLIKRPWKNDRFFLYLGLSSLLFLLSQLISSVISIDPHMSFWGYYSRFNGGFFSLLSYIVIAYAGYFLINKKSVSLLLWSVIAGAALVVMWALPSKIGHDFICLIATKSWTVSCWTKDFNPMLRLFGTLGQPNWLAAYLVGAGAIILYMLARSSQLYRQGGLILLFFLTSLCVAWTNSRSGVLAWGVMIAIFATALFFKKLWSKRLVIVIVGSILGVALFQFSLFDKAAQLVPKRNESPAETVVQTKEEELLITPSSVIRRIVWAGAIELVRQHPVFGTGTETFAISYPKTRPSEHNMTSEWDYIYNKAHNEILNYAATTGIVGLTTYLLFLATAVIIAGYLFFRTKSYDALFAATVGSIVASLTLSNFFGFSTTTVNLMIFLSSFILLGAQKKQEKQSYPTWLYGAIAVTMLFAGSYIIRYYQADLLYAEAKKLRLQEDLEGAVQKLRRAYTLREEHVYLNDLAPLEAQLALGYQSIDQSNNARESQQDAIAHIEKIISASPDNVSYWRTRGRVYYLLSLAYNTEKQRQEALKEADVSFDRAQKLSPTDPKNYASHAIILTETQPERARELLQYALKLKPNYEEARSYLDQIEGK